MYDETPQNYEELLALDLKYKKLGADMYRLWMSSKHRGNILRDIRRGLTN